MIEYPPIFDELSSKASLCKKVTRFALNLTVCYQIHFNELEENNYSIYVEIQIDTFNKTYGLKTILRYLISDQHTKFYYGLEEIFDQLISQDSRDFILFNLNLFTDRDFGKY